MQRILEAEGYRVLGAKDGVEAVELHRRYKNEIALVVLDIRLPKLNGWDAFREMKKQDPQLKTIVATAYVTPEVRSGMATGELHGLFIKPYSVDAFSCENFGAHSYLSPSPSLLVFSSRNNYYLPASPTIGSIANARSPMPQALTLKTFLP